MTRLAFILALFFSAPWEKAETIAVTDHGTVELGSFNCQDVTRSSVINRVCYDAESRRMLVQHHAAYRQYCGLPPHTVDSFLSAPSMGQFFRTAIDGKDTGGPYACPPHRQPQTSSR